MSYYLAPCLVALRDEVNARYPNRDKASDGWIGDTSHSARPSDHNPDWGDGGVVRAIDIDIDGGTPQDPLVQTVLKAAIGDHRVYYVIYNHKIYSRTYGWVARSYTGSNPHTQHIHISARAGRSYENDKSMWLATPAKKRVKPAPISIDLVREQMLAALEGKRTKETVAVRRLQKSLNAKYGKHLATDGIAGQATLNSYGRHERAVGGTGRERIPDRESLPALIQGRYFIREDAVKAPAKKGSKK